MKAIYLIIFFSILGGEIEKGEAYTLDLLLKNGTKGVRIETDNHYSLKHIQEDAIQYCNLTLGRLEDVCGQYNLSYHCRDKNVFFQFIYYVNASFFNGKDNCLAVDIFYQDFKCVENLTDFYKCETSILEYPYVITLIFFAVLLILLVLSPIVYIVHKKMNEVYKVF